MVCELATRIGGASTVCSRAVASTTFSFRVGFFMISGFFRAGAHVGMNWARRHFFFGASLSVSLRSLYQFDDAVSFPFSLLARKSQDFAALTRRRRFRSSFSAWDSFFSAIAQHSEDVNIAPSVIFGGIFAMNGNRV
jgi:hypothetical protein